MSRKPKSFWVCVTVAGLSLASTLATYSHELLWVSRRIVVSCGRGLLTVGLLYADDELFLSRRGFSWHLLPAKVYWLPDWFFSTTSDGTAICLPLWIPFLLSSTAALVIHRRSVKAGPNACGKCGYDLTGNTSGICPECGKPTSADATTDLTPEEVLYESSNVVEVAFLFRDTQPQELAATMISLGARTKESPFPWPGWYFPNDPPSGDKPLLGCDLITDVKDYAIDLVLDAWLWYAPLVTALGVKLNQNEGTLLLTVCAFDAQAAYPKLQALALALLKNHRGLLRESVTDLVWAYDEIASGCAKDGKRFLAV